MFDVNKPVQTRDGRKARIICTDAVRDEGQSICVLMQDKGDNREYFGFRFPDGTYYGNSEQNGHDLINIPEVVESFGLCDKSGACLYFIYETLEEAKRGHLQRHVLELERGVGVVKRTTVDGKLKSLELVHVF